MTSLLALALVIYPHSITPGGPPPAVQGTLSVGYQGQDSFLRIYAHGDFWAWVNYRSGGSVFWTPHPVLIRKGEKVLTDKYGKFYRGRCENGISLTPPPEFVPPPPDLESPPSVQFPVPPEIPPAPWEFSFAFDFPVTGGWPDVPYTPPPFGPEDPAASEWADTAANSVDPSCASGDMAVADAKFSRRTTRARGCDAGAGDVVDNDRAYRCCYLG